jgi:hypothetical protein
LIKKRRIIMEQRQLSEILEEIIVQNRDHAERHEQHFKRIGDFLEKGQSGLNSTHGSESIELLKEILSELKLIRAGFSTEVLPSKTGVLQKVRNLF